MNTDSRTEYQRQFIGDQNGTFRDNYRSMLKERNMRKCHERSHTPLTWIEENQKELSPLVVNKPQHSVPILDESFAISETPEIVNSSNDDSMEKNQEKENEPQVKGSHQSVQTHSDSGKRDVGVQSPCRQRPWSRPKSYRKPLKLKQPSVIQEKPIILYGWADNTSLQKKKTYNVKAPVYDVKATALRAARRREERVHTLTTRKEKLGQEKLKTQVLIDSLTNFDKWQTEYQKEFSLR